MQISLGKPLIFAPDLKSSAIFHTGVLGLELIESEDTFLTLRGTGFELVIFKCEEPTSPDGHSAVPGSAITFAVTNLDGAIKRLRRSNVRILHDEPQVGPHFRYVAFVDPFGTVHEVVGSLG